MVEQGTDIQELMRNANVQPHTVLYNGKEWHFKYRDITWDEHMTCIDKGWVVEDEEILFKAGVYWMEVFLLGLTELPGGARPTRTVISQFEEVITLSLMTLFPGPNLNPDLALVKKA